jgi:hypothetical protein
MMKQLPKISMILGGLLILASIPIAYFQLKTGLKYANIGSEMHWVAPIPTGDDAVILSFPTRWIVIAGVVLILLAAGHYSRNRSW